MKTGPEKGDTPMGRRCQTAAESCRKNILSRPGTCPHKILEEKNIRETDNLKLSVTENTDDYEIVLYYTSEIRHIVVAT